MPDPQQVKRIFYKFIDLYELNPSWGIGYILDQVHFTAMAESDNTELALMTDSILEEALDIMIERSKEERSIRI